MLVAGAYPVGQYALFQMSVLGTNIKLSTHDLTFIAFYYFDCCTRQALLSIIKILHQCQHTPAPSLPTWYNGQQGIGWFPFSSFNPG